MLVWEGRGVVEGCSGYCALVVLSTGAGRRCEQVEGKSSGLPQCES